MLLLLLPLEPLCCFGEGLATTQSCCYGEGLATTESCFSLSSFKASYRFEGAQGHPALSFHPTFLQALLGIEQTEIRTAALAR